MLRIIRRAYGEASAVLGLAAISFAIVQLLGGAGIGWVGTILAWLPLTAYLGFIVLGRPSTRTRTLWPLLAVSGAGVVVAAFAGAVGIVIAVSGLAALSGYLFWYSRQARHPSALVVGSPLPDFPLSTVGGDRVRSSVLTERPQVIVFFRGSWCPFCTTQLRRLAERYRELEHRGVGVVELDTQRASLTDRDREIQPAVIGAQVVEEAQRLPGEVADLGIVALPLQLGDHHNRDDDIVLGEPRDGPWIAQQNRGVQHVGAKRLVLVVGDRLPQTRGALVLSALHVWCSCGHNPLPAPGPVPGNSSRPWVTSRDPSRPTRPGALPDALKLRPRTATRHPDTLSARYAGVNSWMRRRDAASVQLP